ncbi:M12 family metallo-peptidase [Pseudomonas fluorescens]|uniref:M12 family metallo-peptidase n=3 Tax=Pseudomonas TaxID=286 RepID=UPI002867A5B9|nr:M12 family metallo-peptidase [Pseudomonas fluorescens]MDR6160449.1 serralysin [Pseudomonas fluorescens]
MPRPTGYTYATRAYSTGVNPVDSLISGYKWESTKWYSPDAVTSLTYSFITPGVSVFAPNYSADNEYKAAYALTGAQQLGIMTALDTWSAVANITFQLAPETSSSVGDMRFGGYQLMDADAAAWAYTPAETPNAGDVWLGPNTNNPAPVKGTYDFMTFVHEIGHAIGLKHTFAPSANNSLTIDPSLDDVAFSVMSYNNNYSYLPTTPMVLDILAIQSLYGINKYWMTGDNNYSWAPNQSIFETIWDAGGIDTIDASNQLAAVSIDLNEGQYSKIGKIFTDQGGNDFNQGLAIAYGAKIENATGSNFDDILTGNALDNFINGMNGADTMNGGAGNDIYIVDNIGDIVTETGTSLAEIDTVYSYVDYTLGANVEVLNLVGNAVNGTGNALNNSLYGNDGNNVLDGGAGADLMVGGTGNDTYIVDNVGDVISETSTLASEIDTVRASVTYGLSANVENLILTGNGDFSGIGNAQNNVITGNDGNNRMIGGAGLDTLIGGKGNDIYSIDQAGELALVQELAGEGNDTLYIEYAANAATIDLNLGNLLNVENLVVSAAGNFTLAGNDLNNSLNGGSGADFINGGKGADAMNGGAGNDIYIVDNIGDIVTETGTSLAEIDTVYSYVDYTLGANVEVLNLVGNAVNGTGNALNNSLYGNDGNNVLDGGAGADLMVGGTGNDTYIVDNVGDVISETSTLASEIDTVRASVNYSLSANLENLILTGVGNLSGVGNSQNNVITGNDGNNQLVGGAGLDTLIGGKGDDSYSLDQESELALVQENANEGIDTLVIDFNATAQTDTIDLSQGNLQNFENVRVTGTGAFTLLGNSAGNSLYGNSGDNMLDGGAGADLMVGGTGNDTYIVDNVGDVISETSTLASEIDTVRASVTYGLSANVENLILTGNGDFSGIGNAQNNVITGNDGNNRMIGGAGLDTLIGGKGNDIYSIDQAGELALVQELAGEGNDTLYIEYAASAATIDLNLGNLLNVENLVVSAAGNFTLAGNDLSNSLNGGSGADFINGGKGADAMNGGAGNDIYIVDNIGDIVTETGTSLAEIDTVYSYVDYTLGANVEVLNLVGNAVNGTGNALNNSLYGNDGNNVLDGGAGADLMVGGTGNDTYIVDNVGDVISETSTLASEIDTVRASVTYGLSANVENLILTGNGDFSGIGNAQNNVITGNDGNNRMIGGAGLDTLIGGKGNDIYSIDQAGELALVQELAGEGNDTLYIEYAANAATIDLNLGNLLNVENLVVSAAGNFTLAGNDLNNSLNGGSGADFINGGKGADAMNGGAGNDIYIVDNIGDIVTETGTSLAEIDTVYSYVDYTLGANVEVLNLVGNAVNGTGNALNNSLYGNDGNNRLDGGAGLDTMVGGKGDDEYVLDQAGELALVSESANQGTDRLLISYAAAATGSLIDLNLSNLQQIENVTVLAGGDFTFAGNDLNNNLAGGSGNDFINGGKGADTMSGAAGNDTYIVDNVGDVVIESSISLSEIDTVYSYIDYTLGANLEVLNLVGSALSATGNALNNSLYGTAGNNILDGGTGADFMAGGTGNDTYIVDNIGDVVSETSTLASEIDTVRASVNYTLGANLENLILTGSGNIYGVGNSQNNVITGNEGNNQLIGGAGLDTMIGGKGNDIYSIDQAGELALVQELASEGTDSLFIEYTATAQTGTVDLNLNNLKNVENVVVTGAGDFTLAGNDLGNSLTGSSGNDFINGGKGADTMTGGGGNDTYIVDNIGDVVSETGTSLSEIDSVYSYVDYTLGANLEILNLVGSASKGTGNGLNNSIYGNDADNILDGGAGTDSLTGGAGADTFVFSSRTDMGLGASRDVITDFSSLQGDKIDLTKFDANLLQGGMDGFTFIGANDFTGAGQLRFVDHVLSGNVSGNAGADFEIQLVGVNSFSANDLVA